MDFKQKTIATYDTIAQGYSVGHFDHFWIEEFEYYKRMIKGRKVIDLGCGAGRDAAVFIQNGFDYTGIDASAGMLNVARERVPEGTFLQMDFGKTPFKEGEFDGFWAAASFLHVPKKEVAEVLQVAKRIIKNGGVGFISVKEKQEIDEGMIEENRYGGISRYFSFYTTNEFKDLLVQNGFTLIKMSTHPEGDERQTNWLCYFVQK